MPLFPPLPSLPNLPLLLGSRRPGFGGQAGGGGRVWVTHGCPCVCQMLLAPASTRVSDPPAEPKAVGQAGGHGWGTGLPRTPHHAGLGAKAHGAWASGAAKGWGKPRRWSRHSPRGRDGAGSREAAAAASITWLLSAPRCLERVCGEQAQRGHARPHVHRLLFAHPFNGSGPTRGWMAQPGAVWALQRRQSLLPAPRGSSRELSLRARPQPGSSSPRAVLRWRSSSSGLGARRRAGSRIQLCAGSGRSRAGCWDGQGAQQGAGTCLQHGPEPHGEQLWAKRGWSEAASAWRGAGEEQDKQLGCTRSCKPCLWVGMEQPPLSWGSSGARWTWQHGVAGLQIAPAAGAG